MEIPGIVEFVRFRNDDGFAILSVALNAYSSKYTPETEHIVSKMIKKSKYDNFTVVVNMLKPGEKIEGRQCIFVGEFIKHPKYGDQFKSEFYYQDEPKTEEGLQAYLMTLPNIKEVRSIEIIKKFGIEGTIEVLDKHPTELTQINGITAKRVKPIKEAWDRDKSLRELFLWLSEHKINPKIGQKAYDLWGHDTHNILNHNPYRLTEIKGIGFVQADQFANKIMDDLPLNYRIKSCINYILFEEVYKNSNLCTPYSVLKSRVITVLCKCDEQNNVKSPTDKYLELIPQIIKYNLDTFAAVKKCNGNSQNFIYLKSIWDKEKYIAKALYDRVSYKDGIYDCSDSDIENSEEDLRKLTGRSITLDDCQKEAVKSAFHNKTTIITGGGGTGKSTICRCICYLAEQKGLSIKLMSPTGKAAQVLNTKTNKPASTIHRALKLKPDDDVGKEVIQDDIVIIDEFSMVGLDTLYAILKAMEDNTLSNIVFVGDSNQLPSVSPGNFLSDIIMSDFTNVVKLNTIHRQDENSYISIIANQISQGKNSEIPSNASDIKWVELNTESFLDKLTNAVNNFLKKRDIEDLQIIAPKYKGSCGVDVINREIQEFMSIQNGSEAQQLKRQFKLFYIGDKVIQTKNNYSKQIFNGDMGYVIDLGRKVFNPKVSDQKEDYVIVDFYGSEFTFIGDEIDQLQLAWCITVHKFQGSQSPYIIFVMAGEAQIMMYKELVYTAFTRAEKLLCIYGHTNMLRLAPHKSISKERYTNFVDIIREMKENRQILKTLKS